MNTLEPIVGTNAIRASVNVDYDQASSESNEEKYDPSVSALLSVQRTEDTAGGSAIPAGVPGTTICFNGKAGESFLAQSPQTRAQRPRRPQRSLPKALRIRQRPRVRNTA